MIMRLRRRAELLLSYNEGKCSNCGYDNNLSALDFHHLRDKKFSLNVNTILKHDQHAIIEEMSKCTILCRNCHAEMHNPLFTQWKTINFSELKLRNKNKIENKIKLISLFGKKCSRCSYDKNISALIFHHLCDKSFELGISNMSNKRFPQFLEESKKCILLCHNCHMELHHPNLNNWKNTMCNGTISD